MTLNTTKSPPRRITFFSLPAELREQIYSLIASSVDVKYGFTSIQPRPAHDQMLCASHISRRFRDEFLAHLHKQLTFVSWDYDKDPSLRTRDQNFVDIFGPARIPCSRKFDFWGGKTRGCAIRLPDGHSNEIIVGGRIWRLGQDTIARIRSLVREVALEEDGVLYFSVESHQKIGAFLKSIQV